MISNRLAITAMNRDELLRSVKAQLTRANPNKNMQEIERIAMHATKVLKHI